MPHSNTISTTNHTPDTTLARLIAIPKMDIEDLRKLWCDLYKTDCPVRYNRKHLIDALIQRTQELAYGGDSMSTKARLEQNAELNDKRPKAVKLMPGAVLSRAYQGVVHYVTVLEDGFEHNGGKFRSLSGVAKFIAGGTSWSGPKFFGL